MEKGQRKMLPIGARLRKEGKGERPEASSARDTSTHAPVKVKSLEDDIARLEAELNGAGSHSDDSGSASDSNDYSDASSEGGMPDSVVAVKNESGEVVVLKSTLDEDRIEKLPKHLLPLPNCSKGDKGNPKPRSKVSFQMDNEDSAKKRVRIAEPSDVGVRPNRPKPPSGLSKTVQEMMRSYVPASYEKKAFFCRACNYEASSEEDFFKHRETESHLDCVEIERKASYCKLCRKQFTSPEQIKEHLKGKAHKLKFESMANYNRQKGRGVTAGGVKLDRI